jgi:hypothetical protein
VTGTTKNDRRPTLLSFIPVDSVRIIHEGDARSNIIMKKLSFNVLSFSPTRGEWLQTYCFLQLFDYLFFLGIP